MDVVSHLALGRALVALSHRPAARDVPPLPRRRALSAAIVIGAIAPDMDAVLMPFGWDRYLVWHERGTHTFFGILLVAALLASLLRFVIQPMLKRPRTPWRLLWLAAIAGCASHLLLDAVCGGSLHPLWPLTEARLSFSLVGMADPLLAGPLVAFLIIAAIWRRRAFELAIGVLLVLIAVLAAKSVSRQAALHAYEHRTETRSASSLSSSASASVAEATSVAAPTSVASPTSTAVPAPAAAAVAGSGSMHVIEARWASLREWFVYERDGAMLRTWEVDARTGRAAVYFERAAWPDGASDAGGTAAALIEASRRLDTVKRALSLFDFCFPEVIDRRDGTFDVLWSDIRFCRRAACDLRFGGRFDREGRALEQVVLIGTVRQTRPVPTPAPASR